MKKIQLSFLFCFVLVISYAQNWVKHIESGDEFMAKPLVFSTDDGGFILFGSKSVLSDKSNRFSPRDVEGVIFKLDKSGEIVWVEKVRNNLLYTAKGAKFYARGEEIFVLACTKIVNGLRGMELMIFTTNGGFMTRKRFMDEIDMHIQDVFFHNGEICMRATLMDENYIENIFIFTTKYGREISSKVVNIPSKLQKHNPYPAFFISPDLYYCITDKEDIKELHEIKKGKKINWTTQFCPADKKCSLREVIAIKDFRYLFVSVYGELFLKKIDDNGNLIWSKKINERSNHIGTSMDKDGSIVICLRRSSHREMVKKELFKVDSQGEMVWSNTYLKNRKGEIIGFTNINEHGFLMVGKVVDEKDGKIKMQIIKTDHKGVTVDKNEAYENLTIN